MASTNASDPNQYDVVWNSPSKDSGGSMPLGNGDIALNVWIEPTGDLLFYIAKSDAVSENSQLLKLGRIRVKFIPSLIAAGSSAPSQAFKQELRLGSGEIVVSRGGESPLEVRLWVDANRPVIELEATGPKPFEMQASLELWRNQKRVLGPKDPEVTGRFELREGSQPVVYDPDTVLPNRHNQLIWYHRDESSIYPGVLKNEHLETLIAKYPDPLRHRTFGACMSGEHLVAASDRELLSSAPAARQRLSIVALTAQTDTPEGWIAQLKKVSLAAEGEAIEKARQAHQRWWQEFWERSWIHVAGQKETAAIAQGYALQRFMIACCGRGALPIKFNGALFTVDATVDGRKMNADYRAWGSNYWFQNTRHLYWPLVMSGDWDLLTPWYAMYRDALPLATDKTRLYYHHAGANFQETMFFWGLANNPDFGWDNPGVEAANNYVRWNWAGGLELVAMLLDQYDCTQDQSFAREMLLPIAEAITAFYDQHWPRDSQGKIRMAPAQSMETWQQAVNPLPEIAGLRFILPRLIALPKELTTETQRGMWRKTLADLPPIPTGVHPRDMRTSKRVFLPAEEYAKPSNGENTEEYAIFPFRLYGLGKPDLQLAIDTFAARRFRGSTCWAWDPIVAACLGLKEEARMLVTENFTHYGDQRFKWFWDKGHDWIPDLDNGGAGSTALQRMLMQCDGREIRLLPAWPANWDVDFKLHAPFQTTVEAKVHDGRIVELIVAPPERKADVILPAEVRKP